MLKRSALGACLVAMMALLLLASLPATAAEVQVYVQNPDYNGGYASQNDTSGLGNFATSYDNFTLGATTNINLVYWAGSYITGNAGSITGFTVDFWSNSGNAPSALLASFSIAGNANESFVGNDNLGNPAYFYNAGVNFTAVGGTEYWMSVVPDLPFPPQWVWETSTTGDANAYQCYFGACGNIPSDLAFALYTSNNNIPEPGSLLLLGTGVLGLAGAIRRKLLG